MYKIFFIGMDEGTGGATLIDDIDNIIKNGNIREKMTFLYLLSTNQCINNIFSRIISLKYNAKTVEYKTFLKKCNINDETIDKKINYICSQLNISLDNFKIFFVGSELCESNCIKYCNTYTFPGSNILKLSRIDSAPVFSKLRTNREQQKHILKIKDIYPKLSEYEISFIKKTEPSFDSENIETILPWRTGYKLYKVKEDNFLFELSQLKHQNFFISGFSGSTDVFFQMFTLFKNFDVDLSILSCISYMGNSIDHSCYEILMMANPYSDRQYDLIDLDVDLEVNKMITRNTEKSHKYKK